MAEEGFYFLGLDLPGHGLSSHMNGPYIQLRHSVFIMEVLRQLGWSKFHIVGEREIDSSYFQVNVLGHSMGGSVATLLAALVPTMALKLVWFELN